MIYLLSPEYYSSVACLNEMGAAWVIENRNVMIFTSNFDLSTDKFRGGALDPRAVGFYITDEDRITGFVESLREFYEISQNQVVVSKKKREFIRKISEFSAAPKKEVKQPVRVRPSEKQSAIVTESRTRPIKRKKQSPLERYLKDMEDGKLKKKMKSLW